MFFYHTLRPMNKAEEINILEALIGDKLAMSMHPIMKLAQHLRNSSDPTLGGLASFLSTRQLLRLAKRLKVIVFKILKKRCIFKWLSMNLGIPK